MYSLVSLFFTVSIHYLQCIHCLLHLSYVHSLISYKDIRATIIQWSKNDFKSNKSTNGDYYITYFKGNQLWSCLDTKKASNGNADCVRILTHAIFNFFIPAMADSNLEPCDLKPNVLQYLCAITCC